MDINAIKANLSGLLKNINPFGDTNPQLQGNQNFWTNTANTALVNLGRSPVGQAITAIQKSAPAYQQQGHSAYGLGNFINNSHSVTDYVPRFQAPQNNIPLQIGATIANLPVDIGSTIVGRGIVDPMLDVGSLIGRTITGQNLPQYNQVKSAPVRLGFNLTGNNLTPQQILGNVAGIADPILNAIGGDAVPKAGQEVVNYAAKRTLPTLLKHELPQAMKLGGAFGLVQGLENNRNQDLPTQLKNSAISTGEGALMGALLGGGMTVGGFAAGKIRQIGEDTLQKVYGYNKAEQKLVLEDFARNTLGQFVRKDSIPESPTPKGLFNNMLGDKFAPEKQSTDMLPGKNPLYSPARGKLYSRKNVKQEEVFQTLRKAYGLPDKIEIPSPGLSIKEVNSKELTPPTPSDIRPQAMPGDFSNSRSADQLLAKKFQDKTLGNPEPVPWETNGGSATTAPNTTAQTIGQSGANPEQLAQLMNQDPALAGVVEKNSSNGSVPNSPQIVNPTGTTLDAKKIAEQARLASFAKRQSIEVRGGTLAQEMDRVLKTPKDNLNIRLALENPEKINQYAEKATNPEAFKALAKKINDHFDFVLNEAKGQKMPLNEVENYFTHVWDISTPESKAIYDQLMMANAKNFTSGFTKARVVNTISEGLNAGLKLKNEKASSDIINYTQSMAKQISNSAFNNKINEMRPHGAVDFAESGSVPRNAEGKPYLQSNKPGNQGTFIDPEIQKHLSYYSKSALEDNPVVHTLDKVNTALKEIKLAGGLFHGLRESVNYAGQQLMSGHLPDLAGGSRAFIDPKYANSQMDHFISNGTLDAASKMGIDVSSAGGIGGEKTNLFDLMQSKDQIKKATFQRLIPYYILKTVENLPEKSRTPEVGKQIMALYNGLNSEVAGTNKTVSQVARLGFLAPQFNVGKIVNVLSAFKPENTPQANFARQALIGTAIATAIEYQIANFIANKKLDVNPASILSNGVLHPAISLPYKSPTGKALAADLPSSNVADIYKTGIGSLINAGVDTVKGNKDQAMSDLSQAGTDFSHTLTSRTGAAWSLLNQLQSGKDYYGNPINPGNIAQSQLPIPIVQILKTMQPNPKTGVPSQNLTTAALNTAGLRVHNDPNDPQNAATTKYFSDLNKTAQSLNPNEQHMFLSILHPTTTDANGNSIVDKNVYTSPDKYTTLLAHPNLLATEQKFQQSQANHDPLWDLPSDQLRAYMQATVINQNDPRKGFGGNSTATTLFNTLPQSFFTQRQQWIQSLPSSTTGGTQSQSLQMPSDIQGFFDQVNALPKGTGQRKALYNTPLGQKALAFIEQEKALTNTQRADMGLPLLDTSSSGGYSYGSKPKKVSFKMPKVNLAKSTIKAFKKPKTPTIKFAKAKKSKTLKFKPIRLA